MNLDNCDWLLDRDLASWPKSGTNVHRLTLRNLVNIGDKGKPEP